MRFSRIEKRDLMYAGLMVSLAFAVLFAGGYKVLFSFNSVLVVAFVIAFFTAGIGFLLHEMMHKAIAQSYGLQAEFRASYPMLWLAILFSFFGFIIAAPGAVFIGNFGRIITREKNGKISLGGPLTNIVLALIFLIALLIAGTKGLFGNFLFYGLTINSLLAAFNMIPVLPFDGAKILAWHKGIYAITVIMAVGLYLISWFV